MTVSANNLLNHFSGVKFLIQVSEGTDLHVAKGCHILEIQDLGEEMRQCFFFAQQNFIK
jgi:hypothetical protein